HKLPHIRHDSVVKSGVYLIYEQYVVLCSHEGNRQSQHTPHTISERSDWNSLLTSRQSEKKSASCCKRETLTKELDTTDLNLSNPLNMLLKNFQCCDDAIFIGRQYDRAPILEDLVDRQRFSCNELGSSNLHVWQPKVDVLLKDVHAKRTQL